jgi:hypothetical protein
MDDALRDMAVQKILDDRDKLVLERVAVRVQLLEMLKKEETLRRALRDLAAAGRVFNQVVAVPLADSDYDSEPALKKAMEELRRGKPWEPGKSRPHKKGPDGQYGPQIDAPSLDETQTSIGASTAESLRIRDRILSYLESKYPSGCLARELREHLLNSFGIETHEKTVGMTLYRLSKQNLVTRDGRTWFFAAGGAQISTSEAQPSDGGQGIK